MNILRNFFESLITEEKRQKEKQTEAFEITSVEITPSDKLDGEYGMFVFINGYDEEGSTFLRNLEMERVKVQN